MSCHHLGWKVGEPEALLQQFIDWCSTMSNVDQGEIERSWSRWTGKGKEKGLKMGTLVGLSHDAG